jgi:choline dehydrogenase-like flavoprotein
VSDFRNAATIPDGAILRPEVCVIGSGAGGAVVAATLAGRFDVLVLEEGGHHTKRDFKMREDLAYPMLYQEGGARTTKDLGIAILQGRSVGGSTTVNWTTCFRTPAEVLHHWQTVHGVALDESSLRPHWEEVEKRLSIHKVSIEAANRNNRLLWDGAQALGMQVDTLRRNVKSCMQSGFCGMGCPIDAKQSMLVTYLPDAVERGATVLSRCRVDRLEISAGRVVRAHCTVLADDGYSPESRHITVEAKRFVVSAGAIQTPALLIRSGLGGGMAGRRTFLHPAVGVLSIFKDPVEAFFGAPQFVASHALAHRGEHTGVFLEAAPVHPMFAALAFNAVGSAHRDLMKRLPFAAGHGALAIDGFHPAEQGGTVSVRPSGAPLLDYPITERIWESLREGTRALIRIALAAGALEVRTAHDPPLIFKSEADLPNLDQARFEVGRLGVYAFHIMGGAMMGDDPEHSVVRTSDLRHHKVENLHVVDGSVLPTSLGVNPQLTIYGIAHLHASQFRDRWT